jgi:hypothetical protein
MGFSTEPQYTKIVKALNTLKQNSRHSVEAAPSTQKSVNWSLDGVTPRAKKIKSTALYFDELFRAIPESRIRNAMRDHVTIVSLKRSKTNPNRLNSQSLTYEIGQPPRRYRHVLIRLDEGKRFSKSRLLVSCGCDDHMFKWEYALTKRGNSQIVYGNGEPAVNSNPSNYPGCCKHIYTLLKLVKQKNL